MNDNRNLIVALPVPERAEGRRSRAKRIPVGLGLLVVVGLAVSSLTGCNPTDNRRIGLSTFTAAGADKATLARVDCIMYRESRYHNEAIHRYPNGSIDGGLFQINSINAAFWRKVTGTDYWKNWANPWLNARVALGLWHLSGLAPWRGGCLR